MADVSLSFYIVIHRFFIFSEKLGNGNGRIDMSCGSAACKEDFHFLYAILSVVFCESLSSLFSPDEYREIESMMPISASCMMSAVPP